jgi:hypothetical protein
MILVVFDVQLAGFLGMLLGVQMVAVREVGVLRRLGVTAFLKVFGGLAMMLRRMIVMLGGLLVVLGDRARFGHVAIPSLADRVSAARLTPRV